MPYPHHLLALLILLILAPGAPAFVGNEPPPKEDLIYKIERYPSNRYKTVVQGYRDGNGELTPHGTTGHFYDLPGQRRYRIRLEYQQGLRHGPIKAWYPDGTLHYTGFYHQNKQHGPWQYHSKDGHKTQYITYENGQKHGPSKAWYPDEQLRLEVTFKHNRRHGTQTLYYPNGTPQSRLNYHNDQLHGTIQTYYPDGTRKELRTYQHGTRHGPQNQYAPNGATTLTTTMHQGQLHGPYLQRDPQGTIINQGTYREGQRWEGTFRTPGFSGDQHWLDTLKDGQLVDTIFYENGKPKTGEVIEYWSEDFVRRRILMKDGRKTGPEYWFYIDGTVWKEMTWKDGNLHGIYAESYENGQLAWMLNFIDGKREGTESRYNPRGDLIAEGQYRHDKPWQGLFIITGPKGENLLQKFEKGVPVNEFGGKPLESATAPRAPASPQTQPAPTTEPAHGDEALPGESDHWLPPPDG